MSVTTIRDRQVREAEQNEWLSKCWTTTAQYFRKADPPSHLALRTVRLAMGQSLDDHAADIFRFLVSNYGDLPLEIYVRRIQELRKLQKLFESTGRYQASCYREVQSVDQDAYNIALLLSFICTHHRFEILDALNSFLSGLELSRARLLFVGFGTGYELKLTQQLDSGCDYDAFDYSPENVAYARKLLQFFGCHDRGLRNATYPIEEEVFPKEYHSQYDGIVLCELLEHLERPDRALCNVRLALRPGGRIFATMAINLAQEDHVTLYRSADDARRQVKEAGLEILDQKLVPVTLLPLGTGDREPLFAKGNLVAVLGRP